MISVYFAFSDGRSVEDEMPADMLPRVGEVVVDDDRGGSYVVDEVVRRISDGRLQRRATVKLEELT